MTAQDKEADKEAKKAEREARKAEIAAKEKAANEKLVGTGVGMRVFFGLTKGQNPTLISYDAWDIDKEIETADTLPTTLDEILAIHDSRGHKDAVVEKELVRRWILGDNEVNYTEASDPIAEFIEAHWKEEVQKAFRITVRNYANNTGGSIEDAVAVIKPGFIKGNPKPEPVAVESVQEVKAG